MKVTKQGFEVSQFNGVIRIYLRRSLVAMVTNFGTKIAITRLTKESGFLHQITLFAVTLFTGVIEIYPGLPLLTL